MHVAQGTPRSCNTKHSSIGSSLNNSRPSLLVYVEQVGKASAAMVCKESCIIIHVKFAGCKLKKSGDK